jgi:two-component system, NtrC family, response regulator HydG
MRQPVALLICRCPRTAEAVREAVGTLDYLQFEMCADAENACREVKRKDIALVLAHLGSLGGVGEATKFLWAVAATRRACPTLIIAEQYHEPHATALLRAGAADFLAVPPELDKLLQQITALTLRIQWPAGEPAATTDRGDVADGKADLVTAHLGELISQVRRVAPQDTTLLLTGETGTGKTVIARLVHDLSPRRALPFVVVDCATLSAGVIESELFGHVKGAFTGADRDRPGKLTAAGAGTIFLDEVNALPLTMQAKLLRAIGERRVEPVGAVQSLAVRARIVAASNVSLENEVADGRFRADLFYRLNVVRFHMPALRERPLAIAPLAEQFLTDYAMRNKLTVRSFRPEVLEVMECYDWPGNIRELRNVVERAAALCEWGEIGLDDLPSPLKGIAPVRRPVSKASAPLHRSREEAEITQIKGALQKHGNNRLRAAEELGISRMGLYKKLHKYGLI